MIKTTRKTKSPIDDLILTSVFAKDSNQKIYANVMSFVSAENSERKRDAEKEIDCSVKPIH